MTSIINGTLISSNIKFFCVISAWSLFINTKINIFVKVFLLLYQQEEKWRTLFQVASKSVHISETNSLTSIWKNHG